MTRGVFIYLLTALACALYFVLSASSLASSFLTRRFSAAHVAQNHLPFIFASLDKPTHAKWNHSTTQVSFSHAIISPKLTRLHTQNVSPSGTGFGAGFGIPKL